MSYRYQGPDGRGGRIYTLILKLYRGCEPVDNNHADFDPSVAYTIYENAANGLFGDPTIVPLGARDTISAASNDPCILNPPQSCYEEAIYQGNVDLPDNTAGYTVVYQRCCRTNLLTNANTSYNIGATYVTTIPGASSGVPLVNGPYFNHEQAILICAGSRFSYDYSAIAPPGDSESYSFCEAYAGGSGENDVPYPAAPPPYAALVYVPPYSAGSPMGSGVTINPQTGLISGTAPPAGTYVVTVCVTEYQGGLPVGSDRKDFHITVTDCQREAVANIPPDFNNCSSFTINFTNTSTPTKVNLWNFGDGDTSTQYSPVHTYTDTGTYLVRLNVDPGAACGDSDSTVVLVYPVLTPSFSNTGGCVSFPLQFQDLSSDSIGTLDYWHWNFGDTESPSDTSDLSNPSYQYTKTGAYSVMLTVGNSKGCVQQDTQQVDIYTSPPLTASGDTDLCIKDSLQIQALSSVAGNYAWGPPYNLLAGNTADPTVYPRQDTTYSVLFSDLNGCTNTDSVQIDVKSTLLVSASPDTTICLGDSLHLHATSDGKYAYSWFNSSNTLVGQGIDIVLTPNQTDSYTVLATLGDCNATSSSVQVKVVPPPQVNVNPDTTICYGDTIPLKAMGGAFYNWSPAAGLSNTGIAGPLAGPKSSTLYTVSVTDTLGCPKPTEDSVRIGVYPPVVAFAGNDTIISRGQSFQLHASGGSVYLWTPATGLSDPGISDPQVIYDQNIEYFLTVKTQAGCTGYDSINVRYVEGPDIYVPNAFTPNGDGKNDIFRPIPVGIRQMDFFRVYNRWGQLVYQGTGYLDGWDGNFNGKKADIGTYVWEVEGVDLNGKAIFKKGTVILIR